MLFNTYDRTDSSPIKTTESHYDFLNRSSWPQCGKARDLFEEWFRQYPKKDQYDFLNSFQAAAKHQYDAALWEMICYQIFYKQGFTLTHHPEICGSDKTPDFLVTKNGYNSFYLECAVIQNEEEKHQAKIEEFINEKVKSPYYLSIQYENKANSTPNLNNIVNDIQEFIGEYNSNEVDKKKTIDIDGWIIRIGIIGKKSNTDNRTIACSAGGAQFIDRKSLINKLKNKSNKYKNLDKSLVMAINNINSRKRFDEQDIKEVLFGNIDSDINSLDGFFIKNGKPKNQRLNGLIYANGVYPWSLGGVDIDFYNNPWAKLKLDYRLWNSDRNYFSIKNQQISLSKSKGKKIYEILGLEKDWPNI